MFRLFAAGTDLEQSLGDVVPIIKLPGFVHGHRSHTTRDVIRGNANPFRKEDTDLQYGTHVHEDGVAGTGVEFVGDTFFSFGVLTTQFGLDFVDVQPGFQSKNAGKFEDFRGVAILFPDSQDERLFLFSDGHPH